MDNKADPSVSALEAAKQLHALAERCLAFNCLTPGEVALMQVAAAELSRLTADHAQLQDRMQDMAREFHAVINEPMYAGTRADWKNRCMGAENALDALKADHAQQGKALVAAIKGLIVEWDKRMRTIRGGLAGMGDHERAAADVYEECVGELLATLWTASPQQETK